MSGSESPGTRPISEHGLAALEKLRLDVTAEFRASTTVRSLPSRLYHFTDCDCLRLILDSKKLYASLATASNDRDEIRYALELALGLIDRRHLRADSFDIAIVGELLKKEAVEWRPFIVSFCETDDAALHWLHYGRSGIGVAIGFEPASIQTKVSTLFPVIYERDAQVAVFRSVLDATDRTLGAFLPTLATTAERDLLTDIAVHVAADHFWMAAPLLKNPAFAAEREWRLITFDPTRPGILDTARRTGKTQFRSTAGRIVPFKECPVDIAGDLEVVLGYSCPTIRMIQDSSF